MSQTFLKNCRDMLGKLKWEVAGLRAASTQTGSGPEELAFRAFNAAVTAWHLADWVFADMTPAQRAAVPVASLGDLQGAARDKCRALYLCYYVANASKHVTVTKYPDADVGAAVSAGGGSVFKSRVFNSPIFSGVPVPRWAVKIVDGNLRHPAQDVFEEALDYWTQFIEGQGIAA